MNSCETTPDISNAKLSHKIWQELMDVRSKVLPNNDASLYTYEPSSNEQVEIQDQNIPMHKDIETSSFVFTEMQQKFISLLTKNRSSIFCHSLLNEINQKLKQRVILLKHEFNAVIEILKKKKSISNKPQEKNALHKIKTQHQLLLDELSCCYQQSNILYQLMKPNNHRLGVYLLKPKSVDFCRPVPLHIIDQLKELQWNTRVQVQYTNNLSTENYDASVLSHQYQILLNRCSKLHQISLGTVTLTQPISAMLNQLFPISSQLNLHTITSMVSHLITIDLNPQIDNALTRSFSKDGYINSKMSDVSNDNFKEIAYLVDPFNPEKRLESLLEYSIKPLCEENISTVVQDAYKLLEDNEKNSRKALKLIQKITSFEDRLTHVKYSLEMTRNLLQQMKQCHSNQLTIIHNLSST